MWVDTNEMDLRLVEVVWAGLIGKGNYPALMNTIMNPQVPENVRKFLSCTSEEQQQHEVAKTYYRMEILFIHSYSYNLRGLHCRLHVLACSPS